MKQLTLSELIQEHHAAMVDQGFHDPRLSDLELITLIVTEIGEAVNAYRGDDWFSDKYFLGELAFNRKISEPKDPFLIKDALKIKSDDFFSKIYESHIKDTVEAEIADACLRILDFIGLHGINPPENVTLDDVRENCFQVLQKIIPEYDELPVEMYRNDFSPRFRFDRRPKWGFLGKCGIVIKCISSADLYRVLDADIAPEIREKDIFMIQSIYFSLSCILEIAHKNGVDIQNHILAAMRFNRTRPKRHGKIL